MDSAGWHISSPLVAEAACGLLRTDHLRLARWPHRWPGQRMISSALLGALIADALGLRRCHPHLGGFPLKLMDGPRVHGVAWRHWN
jgi:hypothetical protein